MKLYFSNFLLIIIGVLIPDNGFCQQMQITNFIVHNYNASSRDILTIDQSIYPVGTAFILAWESNGQQYAYQLQIDRSNYIVPLNSFNGWQGQIQRAGISLNNVNGEIRHKRFKDNWALFNFPGILSPGSVNFTPPYVLFGVPYQWICLILFIVVSFIAFVFTKSLNSSILIGAVIGLIMYDLRSMNNRWDVYTNLEEINFEIPIFKELENFLSQSRQVIGNKCWTKERLSGVLNSLTTYELADLCYLPRGNKDIGQADFIITTTPRKRKKLLSYGSYHLVASKKTK